MSKNATPVIEVIFEKNKHDRDDIPEIAKLFIDGVEKTHTAVRTSWRGLSENKKQLCKEKGWGENSISWRNEDYVTTIWTLEEARENAKKELLENAKHFLAPFKQYVAVKEGITTTRDESAISFNRIEELEKFVDGNPEYFGLNMRQGTWLRDYPVSIYNPHNISTPQGW